jgi:hypothetical protein
VVQPLRERPTGQLSPLFSEKNSAHVGTQDTNLANPPIQANSLGSIPQTSLLQTFNEGVECGSDKSVSSPYFLDTSNVQHGPLLF